jgi:hypothetical protein
MRLCTCSRVYTLSLRMSTGTLAKAASSPPLRMGARSLGKRRLCRYGLGVVGRTAHPALSRRPRGDLGRPRPRPGRPGSSASRGRPPKAEGVGPPIAVADAHPLQGGAGITATDRVVREPTQRGRTRRRVAVRFVGLVTPVTVRRWWKCLSPSASIAARWTRPRIAQPWGTSHTSRCTVHLPASDTPSGSGRPA